MAENDRIVYPDEVEAVKETAKNTATQAGDSNSIEEPAPEANTAAEITATPSITMRNMIQVPDNCPPGYKLVNGVCREVFD